MVVSQVSRAGGVCACVFNVLGLWKGAREEDWQEDGAADDEAHDEQSPAQRVAFDLREP